ncbi:MAG: hypothetical protein LBJ57_00910 [Prevotellaceae bacterium]|jgi:probable addiction module antidote protein|nr:hypothetical protein [Prevotellaceae bacterium]
MKNNPKVRDFDAARYLKSEKQMADYLNAELADGDPEYIKVALNAIARARGLAGYSTIQEIVDVPDMRLMVVPKSAIN